MRAFKEKWINWTKNILKKIKKKSFNKPIYNRFPKYYKKKIRTLEMKALPKIGFYLDAILINILDHTITKTHWRNTIETLLLMKGC